MKELFDSGFNLEILLVGITLLTGLIIFIHFLMRRGKPKQTRNDNPLLVDYAKSFFPIFLIVLILRSFVAEPFRIPSGSMIPTLEVGDFILVKKYAYGVRLPITHNKILETNSPKRGDVVVFRYPPDPKVNYIKRLVGLPGDEIEWTKDKKLIINGKSMTYQNDGVHLTQSGFGRKTNVPKFKESFNAENSYNVITFPDRNTQQGKWTVPQGHYFMMGDNRDNSRDSRYWDYVPEKNLIGKATMVWMHWNFQNGRDGFQSSRIGTSIK